MKFPWTRAQAPEIANEVRRGPSEDRQFTDAVVDAILSAAQGQSSSVRARETAAAEFGIGLLSRCFASARLSPSVPTMSPSWFSQSIRSLLTHGNAVYAMEVTPQDGIQLYACPLWDVVSGSYRPKDWRYQLDIVAPTGMHARTLPASSVIHFKVNQDTTRPWYGVSPLALAGLSSKLLASIENRVAEEANARAGTLLPVPDGMDDDAQDQLRADLRALAGGVALVETTSAGAGGGRQNAPQTDWTPKRFGANVPEGNVSLRRDAGRDVLAAIGVPPLLWEGGDGASMRESYRQLLVTAIEPIGNMMERELCEKLGFEVKITFGQLAAADIASRARAYSSLLQADSDFDKEQAKKLTGLADE